MADIANVVDTPAHRTTRITWETLTSADDADPHLVPGTEGAVGCIQVTGDFGSDASVALHGSNDGTNYVALSDVEGDVIAITAAGIVEFSTACLYLKPVVSDGTAEDLDVTIVLRR